MARRDDIPGDEELNVIGVPIPPVVPTTSAPPGRSGVPGALEGGRPPLRDNTALYAAHAARAGAVRQWQLDNGYGAVLGTVPDVSQSLDTAVSAAGEVARSGVSVTAHAQAAGRARFPGFRA